MYATKRTGPHHTVDVYDSSTWRRLREIPTPCCSAVDNSSRHKLHVSDDRILLCCETKAKLHVLNCQSGELLQTHGRSVIEARVEDNNSTIGQTGSGRRVQQQWGPGVLHGPRLCQVDADGSVLVADSYNQRLQVMQADGTWNVVDVDDRTLSFPRAAVWINESLYVANYGAIARYSTP